MTKADARDRGARRRSGWPPTRTASRVRPGAGSRCRCGEAWAEFWKHPSPWMISAFLVGAVAARVVVGGGLLVGAGDPGRRWWRCSR